MKALASIDDENCGGYATAREGPVSFLPLRRRGQRALRCWRSTEASSGRGSRPGVGTGTEERITGQQPPVLRRAILKQARTLESRGPGSLRGAFGARKSERFFLFEAVGLGKMCEEAR